MSNLSPLEVASAVATCLEDPERWRAQRGGELLEQSARRLVFDRSALVPIGPVVTMSLVMIAASYPEELPAAEALQAWKKAVHDACESYAYEPEGWTHEEAASFKAEVSICFGVEEDVVHDLIRVFHSMPEGTRLGTLMMLEKSRPFAWMAAEIDAFDREVDLEAPPKAIRRVLRLVHERREADEES